MIDADAGGSGRAAAASADEGQVVDLRGATFDARVRFVFEHPVPAEEGAREWYVAQDLDVTCDPAEQVQFMTELFRAPLPALSCFSEAQLEQGFWFLFGPGGAEHFTRHLGDASVPLDARIACLEAIGDLYAQLFACTPLDGAPYMLWDLLILGLDWGRTTGPLADAALRTLEGILARPEAHCQEAALHGLEHLEHVDEPRALRAYLERADLDEEHRQVATRLLGAPPRSATVS